MTPLTREERLRMLRNRNAVVRSPSVKWLLGEVDRLEQELSVRVSKLRLALCEVVETPSADVTEIAAEALAADDAAAEGGRAGG